MGLRTRGGRGGCHRKKKDAGTRCEKAKDVDEETSVMLWATQKEEEQV